MGAAWWERTALPAAGGIAEQPAKDLMVLEHLEDIANELLQERLQASRARKRETESHG